MKKIILLLLLPVYCAAQTGKTVAVHFDFNKYAIKNDAKAVLDSLVNTLKAGTVTIQLHGHCDFVGNDEYNDALSVQRVKAVKGYLTAAGISATSFTKEEGHGKRLPLTDNSTDDARLQNRRVEITVLADEIKTIEPKEEKTIAAKTITLALEDTATKAGSTLILKNINFLGGLHRFLPESSYALNDLLGAMKKNPKLVIQIQGHICCLPDNSDGLDNETGIPNLSEARARAVYDFLVNNGIDAKRMSYMGFGHSVPMYPYPEQNSVERTLNRRVEIKIISK